MAPKTYLKYLNLLLAEDTTNQLETNSNTSRLIELETPTQENINQLTSLLKERFPSKAIKELPLSFDTELTELRQRPNKILILYYTRATNLIQKYRAKDRLVLRVLTLTKSSLLDTFLRQQVKGLLNLDIKRKIAKDITTTDHSIRKVFTLADETRRINQ